MLWMSLVLSASSSCSPSAFLFLSLSTLAFAVGDPAGSCCSSCSLFSPCGSGSRGLRIPDAEADAVPGVGGAASGSYQSSVTMSILCGNAPLSISGGRSVVMTPLSMIALFAWFLVTRCQTVDQSGPPGIAAWKQ